ncbi:hypothetical protein [Actinomadura atramentaria]|uniref:hypothetical protein n=1 Tax=Actinomadura atramentaria TaxID=1990 RepID=UPI0003792560|nr:hypothetical protein [Actinomadura atramentaria]
MFTRETVVVEAATVEELTIAISRAERRVEESAGPPPGRGTPGASRGGGGAHPAGTSGRERRVPEEGSAG